jgi:hypothetical protein
MKLISYGFIIFDSACIEPMEIKRASVWNFLAAGKVKALKEPKQHQGRNKPSRNLSAFWMTTNCPPIRMQYSAVQYNTIESAKLWWNAYVDVQASNAPINTSILPKKLEMQESGHN